jgi:signal transduction histidine kinase
MHFNDMLARTRSQQTRLRKHEKAAALGVLASGVAHELNNPLSNISTSVQLLQESTDDSEKELRDQWMTHIDQETERARRIVRRLLDSVRQPKLQVQKYEFPALIESSVALVSGQLPESVRVHIVNAPDRRMYVDGERMKQVFINLVKNAANAGAQNIWINASETTWVGMGNAITGEMHGETCQINQPGPVLRVDISDDGPGIADDHLAQIFDPFFTTQTGHDGIGLGLYLVKEIISEHDACIAVDNRSEGGAQFTIGIPLPNEEETE